jgi:hypothetical protein
VQLKSKMEEFDDIKRKLVDYANKYGFEVVSEMLNRLKGAGKYATGDLVNSIEFKVVTTDKTIEVQTSMIKYGEYVDKGRKPGKFPPLSKIQEWCRVKNIPQSAAYPIARAIAKRGIPSTNFWTISTTRRYKEFLKNVERIAADELTPTLKRFFGEK